MAKVCQNDPADPISVTQTTCSMFSLLEKRKKQLSDSRLRCLHTSRHPSAAAKRTNRAVTSVIILQEGRKGAFTFLYTFPITGIHPKSLHKWAQQSLAARKNWSPFPFFFPGRKKKSHKRQINLRSRMQTGV